MWINQKYLMENDMQDLEELKAWNEDSPLTKDMVRDLIARCESAEKQLSCKMGVGDGAGHLFVYGDHEPIKAAQTIVLAKEEWHRKWMRAEAKRERAEFQLKELREQKPYGYLVRGNFFHQKDYAQRSADYITANYENMEPVPVYIEPVAQSRDSAEPEFQCGDSIVHTFQKSSNESAKGLGILQRSQQSNANAHIEHVLDMVQPITAQDEGKV